MPAIVAKNLKYVVLFTICAFAAQGEDFPDAPPPKQKPITVSNEVEGDSKVIAEETEKRAQFLYPSNWGQAGTFRVRSAEALPTGALAFGIGGEYYSINNGPIVRGSRNARTIAEQLFVGYGVTDQLTLGLSRKNSSTTFGSPQLLISSLGDFTLSGLYSFKVGGSLHLAPIVNLMIASNFNDLSPSGNTLSGGGGVAATYSLFEATGLPLLLHANVIYHSPQISSTSSGVLEPETFFPFSRFHTFNLAFGAEYSLGDFIPFLEFTQNGQLSAPVSFGSSPSRLSFGTRILPLNNKSLALLLGADIGVGKGLAAGVPFNSDYQIIGQLSYTVGLTQTERKHYHTETDVNIVDRKFVIRKKIQFKLDSAILLASSTDLLNQIAEVIRQNNVKKLLIVGHTDSTASEKYNLKLSQDRANSVRDYLVSKGIPRENLDTRGYGKRQPIASNATEEGRATNRRVEFFILQ